MEILIYSVDPIGSIGVGPVTAEVGSFIETNNYSNRKRPTAPHCCQRSRPIESTNFDGGHYASEGFVGAEAAAAQ